MLKSTGAFAGESQIACCHPLSRTAAVHAAVTRAAANAQGKIDKAIEKVKKLEDKTVKYAEKTKHEADLQIQQMKGTIEDLKGQLDTIAGQYAEAKMVDLTSAFIADLKVQLLPSEKS